MALSAIKVTSYCSATACGGIKAIPESLRCCYDGHKKPVDCPWLLRECPIGVIGAVTNSDVR